VGTRFLLVAVLLGGCTVGPDFERPNAWSPASWFTRRRPDAIATSVPNFAPLDVAWWRRFNDPVLDDLVERASAENLDVLAATARLAQSRAQRGIAASDLFPQVNGNTSYTRQRPSERGVFSLLGGGSQPSQANGLSGRQGGVPSQSSVGDFDLFQGGFDASWELDLWGRVRRSVESADAALEASGEARRATLLSTVAEVARDYLQLRGTQETLRITRDNLAAAQETSALTRSRSRAGLASELDVANADGQVEANAAQIPSLEQQEAQSINQIGLLLGLPPAALAAQLSPPRPVPPVPPDVPVGLPSELARRRPDIRQAEAQLHSATADIGVAQADFYPKVSLSGSASLQSLQLKDLGDWAARTYSVGPSITVPIFEGGRLRRTVELRQARQQEAAIGYRRTVLQAFTEVDNALLAYGHEQRRRERLVRQVDIARRALSLAQNSFRQGISDFLQVLTAQRTVLQAQQQLAESTTNVSTNLVALYKALGGGWQDLYPEGERIAAARN
jgi:NodT family efflux transporter outer membrane factor (OMF) lipoprotein